MTGDHEQKAGGMGERAMLAAMCAALVLGGAGCFGGSDDENTSGAGQADTATNEVRTDDGSTEASTTPSGGEDSGAADDALGSAKGSIAESTVQLASLERTSPEVVTAKFSITVPDSAEGNFQVSDNLAAKERGFEKGQDEVSGATLTDESGAKRYYVLTDTDGECLCTTNIASDGFIDKGTTAQLYAKFPAPPEGTESVSLEVPTFQSIDDAKIADGE